MLRACVIDSKGNKDDHLPLIEFFYQNSYHKFISMTPFEAHYGRKYLYPIGWLEVGEFSFLSPELVYEAMEKFLLINERFKMSFSR